MSIKSKIIYTCQKCGAQFSKWAGRCCDCGAWNSIEEEKFIVPVTNTKPGFAALANIDEAKVTPLVNISLSNETRISTAINELDRVLGGGLVIGSVTLIGGDPGIGKSTLLLQTIHNLSKTCPTLYISGEESLQQVALRANRLGLSAENIRLLAETNVERIIASAQKEKPQVMVIDSIQTIFTNLLQSAPGGVGQIRESAAQLVRYAKTANVALFIIGHVTKDGTLAGPRVLEHMVDSVLYFEGDYGNRYRIIRAIKNRFGAVNELGVFAMTDTGLKEISNPSAIFLSRAENPASGSVIMAGWEGSRPLLLEIQALADQSHIDYPKRVAIGLDYNRLSMLLAVLHRHGGVATYNQDVFVNVVGGMKIAETAADLALLSAVVSSLCDRPLPKELIMFGEVGLSGEIRPVQNGQERLKEASKHGFKRAIIPKVNMPKKNKPGIGVVGVTHLREALSYLWKLNYVQ